MSARPAHVVGIMAGLVLAALGFFPASAETLDAQRRACNGASAAPDAQIKACAAIAKSDRVDDETRARAHYNAGVVHAEAGRWTDARASFEAALKAAPGNRDAAHNRDLMEKIIDAETRNAEPAPTEAEKAATKKAAKGAPDAAAEQPPAEQTAAGLAAGLLGKQEIGRVALPEDMRRNTIGAGKAARTKQVTRPKTERIIKKQEKAKRQKQDRKKAR